MDAIAVGLDAELKAEPLAVPPGGFDVGIRKPCEQLNGSPAPDVGDLWCGKTFVMALTGANGGWAAVAGTL